MGGFLIAPDDLKDERDYIIMRFFFDTIFFFLLMVIMINIVAGQIFD